MMVLITGSNRGLGLELVKEGLKRGHIIVATYRSLSHELYELKCHHKGKLFLEVMDVSDYCSIESAYVRISQAFNYLDVIINNAAVLFESKYFEGDPIIDLDLNLFYETFKTNIFGPVAVLKKFMPLVYNAKDGCIVNISTEGAKLKTQGYHYIAYCSSKAALNMYTQKIYNYLRSEKTTQNIRVYMIHPGRMDTKMGVENAEISAEIPANGIWDIIERKIEVNLDIPYIDYLGRSML